MTKEEFRKVVSVVQQADGGCPYCVSALLDGLRDYFPEFKEEIEETNKEFKQDDDYGF